MCQPWNLDLHPEQFPRTIRLRQAGGSVFWATDDESIPGIAAIEGKWISDREFEAADGRVFVCPAPDLDGCRNGEVTVKAV